MIENYDCITNKNIKPFSNQRTWLGGESGTHCGESVMVNGRTVTVGLISSSLALDFLRMTMLLLVGGFWDLSATLPLLAFRVNVWVADPWAARVAIFEAREAAPLRLPGWTDEEVAGRWWTATVCCWVTVGVCWWSDDWRWRPDLAEAPPFCMLLCGCEQMWLPQDDFSFPSSTTALARHQR